MTSHEFLIFEFSNIEFFKGVHNSIAFHAQIYVITNGLGGRQINGDFIEFCYPSARVPPSTPCEQNQLYL